MRLGQAVSYFSQTAVDAWDGTRWVPAAVTGSVQVFDRFISARTFGQKKRNFLVGGSAPIPSQYQALRLPDGTRHIITSGNPDMDGAGVYAWTYLITLAEFDIQVVKFQTAERASGLGGGKTEQVVATTFGDVERITARSSDEFETVTYPVHSIYVPRALEPHITPDAVLRIQGYDYNVLEASPLMRSLEVRAARRGTR